MDIELQRELDAIYARINALSEFFDRRIEHLADSVHHLERGENDLNRELHYLETEVANLRRDLER